MKLTHFNRKKQTIEWNELLQFQETHQTLANKQQEYYLRHEQEQLHMMVKHNRGITHSLKPPMFFVMMFK